VSDILQLATGKVPPRWLTVSDHLALITGCAIALVLPPALGYGGLHAQLPAWLTVAMAVVTLLLSLELAIALVVLVRCFQYRAMPRPAEWLAILLATGFIAQTMPGVDDVVNRIYQITGSTADFGLWRWRIAAAALLVVLAPALFLVPLRRRLSPGLRTVSISAMALVLLWAPLPVLSRQFDTLFPPLNWLGVGWSFWLAVSSLRGIAYLPTALLFGVPTAAAFFTWRRGGRRGWLWTEWAGAGVAALLGIGWLFFYYFGSYAWPPTGWISERIVTAVGLVVTVVLSARLVRCCGYSLGMCAAPRDR
jgi:hypothetical protein